MPTLPSGRRIEFSLDRFHAMLEMLPPEQLHMIDASLMEPDDLLWILDLVSFDTAGRPHFAECVAADWTSAAGDWHPADRAAFGNYLHSEEAHHALERGFEGTRHLMINRLGTANEHLDAERFVA